MVSVIVPVYRAEGTIRQCLDSIYSQSYKDMEVIVIDDSEASGAAAARNRGIEKARGELIMFCDADDYLGLDAVSTLVEAMNGVDLVAGSFRKFGDFESVVQGSSIMDRSEVAKYVMGNLNNPRQNQMLSGCWAKLYRREIIGRFPIFTTAEDMAFNFDYLGRCKSVKFIPQVVYNNRKHNSSLSTTFDGTDRSGLFGFLGGLKYVKRFLSEFYPIESIDDAIDNSKVYHSLLAFSRICAQDGRPMKDVLMTLYPC